MECLVVPKVTGKIPSSPVNNTDWLIPKGFQLADPKFHIPDRINMFVGASLYFPLLKRGFVHMWDNYPELRETHLGWVSSEELENLSLVSSLRPLRCCRPHIYIKRPLWKKLLLGLPQPGGRMLEPQRVSKVGNTGQRQF